VPSGLFHLFHQDWSIEIARALNRGILTDGLHAMVEQKADGMEPDVIAVETRYVEPMRVEDRFLHMPLFVGEQVHIRVPLEVTYQTTWEACPAPIRERVDSAS
jgi:hypothetical protein